MDIKNYIGKIHLTYITPGARIGHATALCTEAGGRKGRDEGGGAIAIREYVRVRSMLETNTADRDRFKGLFPSIHLTAMRFLPSSPRM